MEPIFVGYGIGCTYHSVKNRVREKIKLSYLCDKKWDSSITIYDDIPVISQVDISNIHNVKVIIFPVDVPVKESIERELKELGIDYVWVNEILGQRIITGKEIKEEGKNGIWKDCLQNVICFSDSIPDEVEIHLWGTNNKLYFEDGIMINSLKLYMGNNGKLKIGANTRIVGVNMTIAYASVVIGEDCMFASGITVRTDDLHPIFDRNTYERINMPSDIVLGNHVWVGEGAMLLSGAKIGEGSIVGARAVTSSEFKDHVIIAGVPAKVIRENICWSKDSTARMNYTYLSECFSDDVKRYC